MIPSNIPIKLDTTEFSLLIPALAKTYGLGKQIQLDLSLPEPPVISITDNEIAVMLPPDIDWMVETDSGLVRAFTLNSDLELGVDATFTSNSTGLYIVPTLDASNSKFTKFAVTNSAIGDIDMTELENGIDELIDLIANLLDKFIDSRGGVLVPLPSWL